MTAAQLKAIAFRLLCIAMRKYSTQPTDRGHASEVLLRNAVRLHAAETSPADAGRVVLQVLSESPTVEERGAACS